MSKLKKGKTVAKPKRTPAAAAFDASFYVLCSVGCWILQSDALATEDGRERVKDAFRAAMLAGGSYEALQALPEFRAAVLDYEAAAAGRPVDVSRLPGWLARTQGAK
jgi:hypothetical protein